MSLALFDDLLRMMEIALAGQWNPLEPALADSAWPLIQSAAFAFHQQGLLADDPFRELTARDAGRLLEFHSGSRRDQSAGWRENKASGGIVMDVESGEVIVRGLSMPHSPRVYRDRLWVLNSGDGGFGFVDLDQGRYKPVLELPGFTRGLAFFDRYAFVGLSQVRESAVFSGIRIAQLPESERWSGVAVVDIEKGTVAGFLKFEQDVHEVFAVCVLPGAVWPDVINHDPELIGQSYRMRLSPKSPRNFAPNSPRWTSSSDFSPETPLLLSLYLSNSHQNKFIDFPEEAPKNSLAFQAFPVA